MSWRNLVATEEEQSKAIGWRDLVAEPDQQETAVQKPVEQAPSLDLPPQSSNPDLPNYVDPDAWREWPEASEEKKDRSALDVYGGIYETLGTMMTGAFGQAAGGTLGLARGMHRVFMDPEVDMGATAGTEMIRDSVDSMADSLTMQPVTEAGQEYLQNTAEFMEPLTRTDQLGPLAAAIPTQPLTQIPGAVSRAGVAAGTRMAADSVADAASQGARAVRQAPERYTDWRATRSAEAQQRDSQNILTNRWLGADMTDVLSNASAAMKSKFADMAERARTRRDGAVDPITGERIKTKESGAANPRDVIAEEFQMRGEELAQVGQRYHEQIRGARSAMEAEDSKGFTVDTVPLQQEVNENLRKFGIAVDPKTGELDNALATIPEKEFKVLNEAYQRFHRGLNNHGEGLANFGDLEDLKKFLQRTAYQNSRDSGRGGDANEFIKQMSGIVNKQLRSSTDDLGIAYGEANDGLSSIITVFNDMNRVIHPDSDVNFFDADFDSKAMTDLARQSRGLTNNTRAGINLDETLKAMDDTLAREGGNLTPEARQRLNMVDDGQGNFNIETDLRQMAVFAEQLNQLMGDGKVTSFHDLVKSATNGQGGHLANAGYNAIWGNYVGMTADIAKQAGKLRGNNPAKLAKRHDELTESRTKFEDYNREAILESLGVVLGQ